MSNARDISEMRETQVAQAWVNFDGTFASSPFTEENGGIRGSYNITSVTDTAQGVYTVNFDRAFANTNWAMTTSGKYAKYPDQNMPVIALDRQVDDNVAITTTSARIGTVAVTSTPTFFPYADCEFVYASFFGELS
jgi:hypothetical protein